MKIGLVSDSHDHHAHLEKVIALFRQRQITQVIHGGDYVNPGSVRLFQGMQLTGVLGNNDGDLLSLSKAFTHIGGTLLGNFATVTLADKTIGVYHGTEKGLKEALIQGGGHDVLVFGHTHKPENRRVGSTLVLNPGSVHGFYQVATCMILDLTDLSSELLEI